MPHDHPVVDEAVYLKSRHPDMRDIKPCVPDNLWATRPKQVANCGEVGRFPRYRQSPKRMIREPNPINPLATRVLIQVILIFVVSFPRSFNVKCDGLARRDSHASPLQGGGWTRVEHII